MKHKFIRSLFMGNAKAIRFCIRRKAARDIALLGNAAMYGIVDLCGVIMAAKITWPYVKLLIVNKLKGKNHA